MGKKKDKVAPAIDAESVVVPNKLQDLANLVGISIEDKSDEDILDLILSKVSKVEQKMSPIYDLLMRDTNVCGFIDNLLSGVDTYEALSALASSVDEANPRYVRACDDALNFCREKELGEDDVQSFSDYIEQFLKNFSTGDICLDTYDSLWKSYSYENEIKRAFEMGVIEGRNSQIEAIRLEKEGAEHIVNVSSGRNTDSRPIKVGYIEKIMTGRR